MAQILAAGDHSPLWIPQPSIYVVLKKLLVITKNAVQGLLAIVCIKMPLNWKCIFLSLAPNSCSLFNEFYLFEI